MYLLWNIVNVVYSGRALSHSNMNKYCILNITLKNPNWQEADQLAILQAWPRGWLRVYRETTPASGQGGTFKKLWTSEFQVRRPNHSTTLWPQLVYLFICFYTVFFDAHVLSGLFFLFNWRRLLRRLISCSCAIVHVHAVFLRPWTHANIHVSSFHLAHASVRKLFRLSCASAGLLVKGK